MSQKSLDYSFSAIAATNCKKLILGSMPGKVSLEQQQYYAHPRNAFWSIMAELTGVTTSTPYQSRCEKLIENHIAVWDVLQACHRPGSLDQHIDDNTILINDFEAFLSQHRHIESIYFNGAKSEQLFIKKVLPTLSHDIKQLTLTRLPSTSPANAAMKLEEKKRIWLENLTL